MPDRPPPRAVCVAGMHRSGTSMVAHLLAEAGLDLGPAEEFLPASADNADGYWENRRFVALNDALLAAVGGGWDAPPAVEEGWERGESLAPLARRARELVDDLALTPPWAWKDPRNSLTLPFWRSSVGELRLVVCVRSPIEVALSLHRRAATSPALAIELWREYNRRLLAAAPPDERVVSVHDDYFLDPRAAVERLLDGLGVPAGPEQIEAAAAVPKGGLRHHAAHPADLRDAGVPADVADLYEALVAEARTGEPAELPSPARSRPARPRETAGPALAETVALHQQSDHLRSAAAEARRELHRVSTELERVSTELERVRSESERTAARGSRLASERDRWRAKAERAAAERDRWQEEAIAARATVEQFRSAVDVSRRDLQAAARERERWHVEAARAQAELAARAPAAGPRRSWRSAAKIASWLLRPTPRRLGYLRAYQSMRAFGAFDREEYLRRNPDVASTGLDPLLHYVEHGRKEGRRLPAAGRPAPLAHEPPEPPARETPAGDDMDDAAVHAALADDAVVDAFDPAFYRDRYPDVSGGDEELLEHYLRRGWREGHDPCDWFSTAYYLARNRDIREAGLNPFVHYLGYGRDEGRRPADYLAGRLRTGFRPTVSAIVPNYNHGRFLEQRLRSIAEQERRPDEIVVLDDASTDESRAVIERVTRELDIPVLTAFNETRSGNVFAQWRKGLALASGDLVWICESDDFCDLSFLDRLVPHFADPSVMIAFGKIHFADEAGLPDPWLDLYREEAAAGYWDRVRVESAFTWFQGPFGLANVIPNVGGCVFRRQTLADEVWERAQRFSACGDWYLYTQLARGGRIAYDPDAVSYFRQHSANTSVAHFASLSFYEEHAWIAEELRRSYGISDERLDAFAARLREHFSRHVSAEAPADFEGAFDLERLKALRRERRHLLIGILGFSTGGAEIFPINLANELAGRGYHVSVAVLDPAVENPGIRARLRPEIPVYERPLVEELGLRPFLETHGIDLVHTHFLGVDRWLHEACREAGIPYVVTLHGSYEVDHLEPDTLESLLGAVTRWIYTADKNLGSFDGVEIDPVRFRKLPNAVPEELAATITRAELGVAEDSVVFGIASRALTSKGWGIAVEALDRLRREVDRPLAVVFCGDGEDYDELAERYGGRPDVSFLGHRSGIVSFYRACDCCLLPTRFPGESFPFTLIESLLAGTPIIATDIGEIATIVHRDDESAGVLVPYLEDDDAFTAALADAMRRMLDDETRAAYARGAAEIARAYSFTHLTSRYEELYAEAAGWLVPA